MAQLASTQVDIGDQAPEVTLPDGTSLASHWQAAERGLALILLRHFGCPFCKEHAREIHEYDAEFAALGIAIVIVGPGTVGEANAFKAAQNLPYPVYGDEERALYRAFGVGRASASQVFTPQSIIGGIRAAGKGYLPKRSAGDPLQLQGQFLIDRAGIVRSVARPARMSEIPSVETLLADARRLEVG